MIVRGSARKLMGPHGERTYLGAVYGGHEYFECWLNSDYPIDYNGYCGLNGIDDNEYVVGILDGWESRS